MNEVQNTIRMLRARQAYRAAGGVVSYTTDPVWLVQMAINRRAGWLDDPTFSRGSCMPVNGRYPKKAAGDAYNHLRLIAREVNTPGLIVRAERLGEWRKLLLGRIPGRIKAGGE